MSSTLGDLLREVAEPGPNRNSFHSTAHFPSGIALMAASKWRLRGISDSPIRCAARPICLFSGAEPLSDTLRIPNSLAVIFRP
jgi:hypothetical protein